MTRNELLEKLDQLRDAIDPRYRIAITFSDIPVDASLIDEHGNYLHTSIRISKEEDYKHILLSLAYHFVESGELTLKTLNEIVNA